MRMALENDRYGATCGPGHGTQKYRSAEFGIDAHRRRILLAFLSYLGVNGNGSIDWSLKGYLLSWKHRFYVDWIYYTEFRRNTPSANGENSRGSPVKKKRVAPR